MSDVYPINDYGPIMPGLLMAAVAIVHVFLAQFAVGGGVLLCYFHWLGMQRGDVPPPAAGGATSLSGQREAVLVHRHARRFVQGYFKLLVLISFIVGALTGVGIWFTAIQVSPATIGDMVHNFHWLWATEWTFFCLEIVSGYCFYRYHERLSDRAAMGLLVIYTGAAWMSLFIINGILSWQLTPGRWLQTHSIVDGFFNPSFWPSLLFRTVVATTLAALVGCIVVNTMTELDRESRRGLIHRTAYLLIPMVLMPGLGIWYLAAMPADSRSWVLGGSPAMMLFMNMSVGASLAIGAYALIGLLLRRLYVNGATATLLLGLAFVATAGGEFVREGARKPFSIRQVLYSNSIRPDEVARLREVGCLADDPYPLRDAQAYPNDLLRMGARVERRLCSVCHTVDGVNALADLTAHWDLEQMRMNIAKLQHTKPFMPPFAGTPEELEALVQFLKWSSKQRPTDWPSQADPQVLAQIAHWLEVAGTQPGDPYSGGAATKSAQARGAAAGGSSGSEAN